MNEPGAGDRTFGRFIRDFGPLVAVLLAYFLMRAQAPADADRAVKLAVRLIDFEKGLGLFQEQRLQSATTGAPWSRDLAAVLYAYLHFPVLAGMGAWLWWRDPARFRLVRNTLYASMVIGLAFYYLLPVAPPRLLAVYGHDYGFVDTVFGGGARVPYPQPSFYVNDFAALPSYHFGWMVLATSAIWVETTAIIGRLFAVLLLLAMAWASAATANHLFIDMVIGAVAVGVSWAVANWISFRLTR